jgi:hypothetical protein
MFSARRGSSSTISTRTGFSSEPIAAGYPVQP